MSLAQGPPFIIMNIILSTKQTYIPTALYSLLYRSPLRHSRVVSICHYYTVADMTLLYRATHAVTMTKRYMYLTKHDSTIQCQQKMVQRLRRCTNIQPTANRSAASAETAQEKESKLLLDSNYNNKMHRIPQFDVWQITRRQSDIILSANIAI